MYNSPTYFYNRQNVFIDGNYNGNHNPEYVYIYALGVSNSNSRRLLIEDRMNVDQHQQLSSNLVYIGSTVNPVTRIQDHYKNGTGKIMQDWMRELKRKRKKPFMRLLKCVDAEYRLKYESYYCRLLYNRVRHNILNRSLLPELVKKEFKIDLEPLFEWDFEHECYSIGI